jgi:hypothetical protein
MYTIFFSFKIHSEHRYFLSLKPFFHVLAIMESFVHISCSKEYWTPKGPSLQSPPPFPREYNEASETAPVPRFTSTRGYPRAPHFHPDDVDGDEPPQPLLGIGREAPDAL